MEYYPFDSTIITILLPTLTQGQKQIILRQINEKEKLLEEYIRSSRSLYYQLSAPPNGFCLSSLMNYFYPPGQSYQPQIDQLSELELAEKHKFARIRSELQG